MRGMITYTLSIEISVNTSLKSSTGFFTLLTSLWFSFLLCLVYTESATMKNSTADFDFEVAINDLLTGSNSLGS